MATTGAPPPLDSLTLDDPSTTDPTAASSAEQKITPFSVSGAVDSTGKILPVDYDKLTRDFGASPLTPELIARFERVTGTKAHRYMRRGMVISHRELGRILDRYERGEPFFLYTGRGPSSDSMHVGHATPFEFTKYLQETFDVPLVIMLTDDEKYLYNVDATLEGVDKYMKENAKDIIGLGFDADKTFMFSDIEYMGGAFYKNILRLEKRITVNSSKATFGHTDSSNIGLVRFVATQAATSYATSFPHIFGTDEKSVSKIPCLIPCAIDQDPYFRQCREHAEKLKFQKPALIHSVFLPALQGPGSKMSASDATSAIFLSDTPKQIKTKINRYAFSGGQDTVEKHRELGGRADVDVPYQYLKFFMEDDAELERIRLAYEKGDLLTGELKALCISYLQDYVAAFQERRAKVTEDVRREFMTARPLRWGGNRNPKSKEQIEREKGVVLNGAAGTDGGSHTVADTTAKQPEIPARSSSSTTAQPQQHTRKTSKVEGLKDKVKDLVGGGGGVGAGAQSESSTNPSTNGHSRQPSKRLSRSGG